MINRLVFSFVFAFCASLAVVGASYASIAAGSEPKDWPASPDRHVVSVERVSKTKTEAQLISVAENTYPSAADMRRNIPEMEKSKIVKNQWWYATESAVMRMPYALTKGAIDYYYAMVVENKNKTWNGYVEPSSKFTYKATVEYKPSFTQGDQTFANVYVVKMAAIFDASFTLMSTEMQHFQKDRTVVLSATRKVLAVFGDGKTDMPIAVI